jgi:hypothetical protein
MEDIEDQTIEKRSLVREAAVSTPSRVWLLITRYQDSSSCLRSFLNSSSSSISEILHAGTMPVIPELSSANRSGSRMARKWWRMAVPVAAGLPS